jgi:hypothetical protein
MKYLELLHNEITSFTDISILEKTIEIYLALNSIIYTKIPNLDDLIVEMIVWKGDKQNFGNRPRFQIMDTLDFFKKNGIDIDL